MLSEWFSITKQRHFTIETIARPILAMKVTFARVTFRSMASACPEPRIRVELVDDLVSSANNKSQAFKKSQALKDETPGPPSRASGKAIRAAGLAWRALPIGQRCCEAGVDGCNVSVRYKYERVCVGIIITFLTCSFSPRPAFRKAKRSTEMYRNG
jgi:hypothetical protein